MTILLTSLPVAAAAEAVVVVVVAAVGYCSSSAGCTAYDRTEGGCSSPAGAVAAVAGSAAVELATARCSRVAVDY